ncbi:MAG TPA: transporter substrate-binding domain-containing protein, partial [Actinomycetota bacterium]|nr:transporter substrate-binding domain-containing protein [Actinomycetota bacterium]
MRTLSRLGPVVLALGLAACVPPIPDNDELVSFDVETVMGEIQEEGTLVAGMPEDAGQPWVDFATPVAQDLAASLNVELEIESHPTDELVGLVDAGAIDVAFPVLTITEELVRKHAFSDPIYVAHQRLLVPAGEGVETVADLSGEVCSPIDDATGVELQELDEDLVTVPLESGDAEGCIPLLEDGLVASATAPDVLLAAVAEELGGDYEVTGEQLTTEPLAVA